MKFLIVLFFIFNVFAEDSPTLKELEDYTLSSIVVTTGIGGAAAIDFERERFSKKTAARGLDAKWSWKIGFRNGMAPARWGENRAPVLRVLNFLKDGQRIEVTYFMRDSLDRYIPKKSSFIYRENGSESPEAKQMRQDFDSKKFVRVRDISFFDDAEGVRLYSESQRAKRWRNNSILISLALIAVEGTAYQFLDNLAE
jgi:hypothetical protein